jgi:hypothetical protein
MAEEKQSLPTPPEGMVAHEAPKGCKGHWFSPNPEWYLNAGLVDEWLNRDIPAELQNSAGVFRSFYRRAIFCEFHLETSSGKLIPITEETLISRSYPALLAYQVHDALEPMLSELFSKKK